MSLYNVLNGVNPSSFFILPLLGKHPDEYPRFRDCWIDEEDNIVVYTRCGGGNRGEGYGEEELYKHPNFITTTDDEFDSTYAEYIFSVPEEWKSDYDAVKNGEFDKLSDNYIDLLYKIYPKLSDNIDEIVKVRDSLKENKEGS